MSEREWDLLEEARLREMLTNIQRMIAIEEKKLALFHELRDGVVHELKKRGLEVSEVEESLLDLIKAVGVTAKFHWDYHEYLRPGVNITQAMAARDKAKLAPKRLAERLTKARAREAPKEET